VRGGGGGGLDGLQEDGWKGDGSSRDGVKGLMGEDGVERMVEIGTCRGVGC